MYQVYSHRAQPMSGGSFWWGFFVGVGTTAITLALLGVVAFMLMAHGAPMRPGPHQAQPEEWGPEARPMPGPEGSARGPAMPAQPPQPPRSHEGREAREASQQVDPIQAAKRAKLMESK